MLGCSILFSGSLIANTGHGNQESIRSGFMNVKDGKYYPQRME
jgi:hypothetical protein